MTISLYPAPKVQYFDDDGTPLNGGKVYFYEPGLPDLKDTYTDEGGLTASTNPVILDAFGRAEIWLNGTYDVQLDRSNDTTVWTVDNVSSAGAATTTTISEWIALGDTPTFISTTQFSVIGDQRTTYQVGRRVKCTETAGTVYGRVSAVAFTTITTVTVVLDSGNLDSGLTVVNVGILSRTNSSMPTIPDATVAEHATTAQQINSGELTYAADTGAADAYVITLALAITAYTTGMEVGCIIANANLTTTPTLEVNGLGTKTIKREASAALFVDDLPAGYIAIFKYDGTDMILINPALPTSIIEDSISVDTVNEKTTDNGVAVDGLSIKDGKLNTTDSVVVSNITANSIIDAKIDKSFTAGNSGIIATTAYWTPSAGIYNIVHITGTPIYMEVNDGSWRRSSDTFGGGLVITDGTNVRFLNSSGANDTFYYLKMD